MREPVVAGSFYPADPQELAEVVDRFLERSTGTLDGRPWGIVVPHAGYRYSGPIAATAYAALRSWVPGIASVLLLGPAHLVPMRGCAVTSEDAWRTPLGEVPVDEVLRSTAVEVGCTTDDVPHEPEHALEVQLPFLQRLFGDRLRILPVAVGAASGVIAAALLDRTRPDLIVVSTDLSHYLRIDEARAGDARTADAIVRREVGTIGPRDACGVDALRAVVAFACRTRRPITLLDLRTSGDTAGDPERVVGYGAFAIATPERDRP